MIPAIALERALGNGGHTGSRSTESNDGEELRHFATLLEELTPPDGGALVPDDAKGIAPSDPVPGETAALPAGVGPVPGEPDLSDDTTRRAMQDAVAENAANAARATSTTSADAATGALPAAPASGAIGAGTEAIAPAASGAASLVAREPNARTLVEARPRLEATQARQNLSQSGRSGFLAPAPRTLGAAPEVQAGRVSTTPVDAPPLPAGAVLAGEAPLASEQRGAEASDSAGTAVGPVEARVAALFPSAAEDNAAPKAPPGPDTGGDASPKPAATREQPAAEGLGDAHRREQDVIVPQRPRGALAAAPAPAATNPAASGEDQALALERSSRGEPLATLTLTHVRAVVQDAQPAVANAAARPEAATNHAGRTTPAEIARPGPTHHIPAAVAEEAATNESSTTDAGARLVAAPPSAPRAPSHELARLPLNDSEPHVEGSSPRPPSAPREPEAARRLPDARQEPTESATARLAGESPERATSREPADAPAAPLRPSIEVRADGSGLPMASAAANVTQPVSPLDATHSAFSAPRPAAADALAHQAALLTTNGGGRARIRLHPPELGQVEISVRIHGSTVDVQVRAEESAAVAVLADGRERLAEAMATRELRIENFEVSGPDGRASSNSQDQSHAQADRNPAANTDARDGGRQGAQQSARDAAALDGGTATDAALAMQSPADGHAQIDVRV